jgi:hypothetical protein
VLALLPLVLVLVLLPLALVLVSLPLVLVLASLPLVLALLVFAVRGFVFVPGCSFLCLDPQKLYRRGF